MTGSLSVELIQNRFIITVYMGTFYRTKKLILNLKAYNINNKTKLS